MKNYQNRTLGAFEKTFWLLDQIDSKDFALAAEIEGIATVPNWHLAINAVQDRHPNLSVAIIPDEYNRPVFKPVPEKPIPLRLVSAEESYRWETEVEKELAIRFDTSGGPLVRAVLVQKPESSVFILISHHSIGDGTSVSYFMRDILQALNGRILHVLNPAISNDELLGFPEDVKNEPNPKADRAINQNKAAGSVFPKIDRLHLSHELTAKIVSRSREERTTVHGALCAAVLIAVRNLNADWNDKKLELISPICSRRALHIGDDFNLNITTHPVYFEPMPELSFWELARIAKEGLATTTGSGHVKNYIQFFRDLTFNGQSQDSVLEVLKNAFNHEIMITNLGSVKYDTDFGEMKLKALWGPMVLSGKGKEQTIGVVTSNGQLCLTNTSQSLLPSLLTNVASMLSDACLAEVTDTLS